MDQSSQISLYIRCFISEVSPTPTKKRALNAFVALNATDNPPTLNTASNQVEIIRPVRIGNGGSFLFPLPQQNLAEIHKFAPDFFTPQQSTPSSDVDVSSAGE